MAQWSHSLWWKPSAFRGLMGSWGFGVLIVLTYWTKSLYRGGETPSVRTKAGRAEAHGHFCPYLDMQAIPLPAAPSGSEIPVWSELYSHAPSSTSEYTQDHSNGLHKKVWLNLSHDGGLQDGSLMLTCRTISEDQHSKVCNPWENPYFLSRFFSCPSLFFFFVHNWSSKEYSHILN